MLRYCSSSSNLFNKLISIRCLASGNYFVFSGVPIISVKNSVRLSSRALTTCLIHKKFLDKTFKKFYLNHYKLITKSIRTSASTSSSNSNENKDKDNNEDSQKSNILKFIMIAYLCSVFYLILRNKDVHQGMDGNVISWEEFKHEILAKGEAQKLIYYLNLNEVWVYVHPGAVVKNKKASQRIFKMTTPDTTKFEEKLREAEQELGISPQNGVPLQYISSDSSILPAAIFTVLLFLLPFFMFRKMKMPMFTDFMQMTRAKFTLVDPLTGQGKGVKFSDVAGLKEAKIEIMEFVDYLKRPEYYRNLGAKVPKGALLLGPPGCGKTLLAKAVATEANVPFLSMNGSEFIELIGGLGAARVRNLFKEAKKRLPCIIYIDEIDAIGKKRSGDANRGVMEEEQTLNQLLVEMDGLVSNEGVILLASTNRADVLDLALLRPGRFDRQILIDLPTMEERNQIFHQHLKSIHLEQKPEYYSKRLAQLTPGFSGADIANVCNEAALHAARHKKNVVQNEDLEYAVERVVGGTEKRSSALSSEEKEMLAYYEAGRGLVGWLSKYGEILLKITIVPRTVSIAGWTQFSQNEKYLYSKEELLGKMEMGLGGGVALSMIFNKMTSRSEKDLKKVTKLAYAQVRHYGMSQNLGLMSFDTEETDEKTKKPYSKQMAALYDEEVRQIISSVYKTTQQLLEENKDKLLKLAKELLKKETLNYDDVVKLIGPPPHPGKKLIEPFEFEQSLKQAGGPEPSPSPPKIDVEENEKEEDLEEKH